MVLTMQPSVKSNFPHVIWPAVVDDSAAQYLAMQFQLEQSQWMESQMLLQKQLDQLGDLVHHAYKSCRFYNEFYQSKNFRPKRILTRENWTQIPIISREQVQQAGQSLLSTAVPPQHGASVDVSTSGSTGRQITVKSNELNQFFQRAFSLREHLWHKRDFRGKMAVIKLAPSVNGQRIGQPPEGSASSDWGPPMAQIYKTGPSVILDISATINQQILWLQKHKPDYLMTYPSNLVALTDYCRQEGIRIDRVRELRTLGETLSPAQREYCEQYWQVPIRDGYSCQEAGILAFQCPDHEHYHVQSENILLEILDDDGQACKPGQVGRVVISNLHNYSTPLIRYEIGDMAEVGEPCACGRGLTVIKRIHGRVRNMLQLPNGDKRWPFIGSSQYRSVADIRQFQLVQEDLDRLTVNLVCNEPLDDAQRAALTAIIQKALQHQFELQFNEMENIPRSAGGKFEDFICRLNGSSL